MRILVVLFALVASAAARDIPTLPLVALPPSMPDTPSVTRTAPAPVTYPDYSEHLTWKQAVTSKRFLIVEGLMAGAMAFDDYQTVRGLRECPWLVEKNQFWWVGPRPTAGELVTRDLTVFGIVTGVNLLASKYLSPWVTIGPGSAFVGRHVQGGVEWMRECR